MLTQLSSYLLDIPIRYTSIPILNSKKVYWHMIAHELIWMLSGKRSIKYLQDNKVRIWDKDVARFDPKNKTDAGRVYGVQWRDWQGPDEHRYVDQIAKLLHDLKERPMSRRHIVTAWNPGELDEMCLPPCHWSFEIIVRPNPAGGGYAFTLKWHQRSVDTFLGLPFDITSYAILGKLIQRETGYVFSRLIGDLSNVHIYEPHKDALAEQMSRRPRLDYPLFAIEDGADFYNLNIDDFDLSFYNPHPPIKGELITPTT